MVHLDHIYLTIGTIIMSMVAIHMTKTVAKVELFIFCCGTIPPQLSCKYLAIPRVLYNSQTMATG